MSLYELRGAPELESPVLVVQLEGWIDAGLGASAAMAYLLGNLHTELVAAFDADQLIDHRARRPVMRIVDGVNTGLTWPEIELRAGNDPGGNDILLLTGPEPDMRWHAFVKAIVGLTADMGVRMVCGLGAFPAPVPHTRPVKLAATATTPELARQVGFVPGALEVPGAIGAALEMGFASAGIPAVGLWARVPHYVAAMPYPAASAALIDGLRRIAGLEMDTAELDAAADITRTRIDEMIANSAEHSEMVHQLESNNDESEAEPPMSISDLPTGDELAAELERFLRNEGDPGPTP